MVIIAREGSFECNSHQSDLLLLPTPTLSTVVIKLAACVMERKHNENGVRIQHGVGRKKGTGSDPIQTTAGFQIERELITR